MTEFKTYFTKELSRYAEQFRIPNFLIVRCAPDEISEVIRYAKIRLGVSAYSSFLYQELDNDIKDNFCEILKNHSDVELKYGTMLCFLDCHKLVNGIESSIELGALLRVECDFVAIVPKEDTPRVCGFIKSLIESARYAGRKTDIVFFGDKSKNNNEENTKCTVSTLYMPRDGGAFMKLCSTIQRYSSLYSVSQTIHLFKEPIEFPIQIPCQNKNQAVELIRKLDRFGVIACLDDDEESHNKVSIFLPNGIPNEKLFDLSKEVIRYSSSHQSLLYCILHLDEQATIICSNMSKALILLGILHRADVEAWITHDFDL